ncbi:two-component regulator propeller domain-containing protein [Candidatus Latescibacterota bacterium]
MRSHLNIQKFNLILCKVLVILVYLLVSFFPLSTTIHSEETWTTFTDTNTLYNLYVDADSLWTHRVRWNIAEMTYEKETPILKKTHLIDNAKVVVYDDSVYIKTKRCSGTIPRDVWDYLSSREVSYDGFTSIEVIAESDIWFSSWGGGLHHYEHGQITTITETDGLPDDRISRLAVTSTGELWIGTYIKGIWNFDGVKWNEYLEIGKYSGPLQFLFDSDDKPYIATYSGIGHKTGEGWILYKSESGLPLHIRSIAFAPDGTLWAASWDYGVARLDGDSWTVIDDSPSYLNRIAFSEDGMLWAASQYFGLYRYDGNSWTNYRTGDGPATNRIYDSCFDSEGNYWCGTSRGLSKYDGHSWISYPVVENSTVDDVPTLDFDSSNVIWCRTRYLLTTFHNGAYEKIDLPDFGAPLYIFTVEIDNQDNIWIGTNIGIVRYDRTNWILIPIDDGLLGEQVTTIAIESNDDIWCGTRTHKDNHTYDTGLGHFNGESWEVFNLYTNWLLYTDCIMCIEISSKGEVWCGTDNGLAVFDGEKWDRVELDSENNVHVSAITCSEDGTIWIGTNHGLYQKSNDRIVQYTSEDGLIDNEINTIAIAEDKSVWIGTNSGISRFIPDEIVSVNEHKKTISEFNLICNYPNPFNPTTTITFTLPEPLPINLDIYSVTCQKVATLVDGIQETGTHSVVFDGTGMPSGVYLYRLESSGYTATGKMLLMK